MHRVALPFTRLPECWCSCLLEPLHLPSTWWAFDFHLVRLLKKHFIPGMVNVFIRIHFLPLVALFSLPDANDWGNNKPCWNHDYQYIWFFLDWTAGHFFSQHPVSWVNQLELELYTPYYFSESLLLFLSTIYRTLFLRNALCSLLLSAPFWMLLFFIGHTTREQTPPVMMICLGMISLTSPLNHCLSISTK